MINKNIIKLSGRIVSEVVYSHSVFDEDFYTCVIEIPRLSDAKDLINLTFPKRMTEIIRQNEFYTITGQLRSYNKFYENKTSLILTVFVKTAVICNVCTCENEIELTGYVCKEPIYRKTPYNRQICDLLVAVNRGFNKSDYIPCIAWGSSAFFSSTLKVGSHIKIVGRLQSREYDKVLDTGEVVKKTAFEVSIKCIEVLD